MSTYTLLKWPVQDEEAVCKLQNVASAGALILDGTLVNTNIPDQVSFIKTLIIRSISLTSVNNLSGTNFVITGLQNGAFVTETLAGPNNNTVYGTKCYDIIISVVTSGAVTGIKVGTGSIGFLPLLMINTNAGFINYTMSADLPAGSGINYSVFQTLAQVSENFIPFQNQMTSFFPYSGLTNQTTSTYFNSTIITNFVLLRVNSSATPTTDTFDFIFLQE